MTTLTADACAHIGFLAEREVPPTPDVRKSDDELDPTALDQHRKALAAIANPIAPDNAA